MKISICSTSHKHTPYLETYVDGVISQIPDFPNLEIIVVIDEENNSKSLETLGRFLDLIPNEYLENFVFRVTEKNIGGPAATTLAYSMATGDYIAPLETDDYYKPNKLKKTIDFIKENDLDGACTEVSAILPDGRFIEHAWKNIGIHVPKDITFDLLLGGNRVYTCSFVHHRKWLRKVPTPLEIAEKFDYMGDYSRTIYMLHKGAKIGYLDEPLSVYRDSIGIIKKNWNRTVQLDAQIRDWASKGCKWKQC